MAPDSELLRRYVKTRSEEAFAELVRRHVDLVYSAALRQVNGDAHAAEDVTQQVFTDLAAKAGELSRRAVLTGWLYTSAHFAAAKVVRGESRRRAREQEATTMNDLLRDMAPEPDWERLRPVLDEAMHQLAETDREAVLLRYFEGRQFREIGAKLGLNENAARMRADRALDKLQAILKQRGVTFTVAALGTVLAGEAVSAAPIGLVATISTAAATATTVLTTTKVIAMTALQKTAITVTLAAAMGTGIYEAHLASQRQVQNQTLQQQQVSSDESIRELQRERDEAAHKAAALLAENEQLRQGAAEVTRLQGASQELAKLKSASGSQTNDPMEPSVKDLLAKINFLKQKFDQMPDKKIPELQFLDDEDWARFAQMASMAMNDDEIRALMFSMRDMSKQLFAPEMGKALQRYALANNGQLPADVLQLQPYFESRPGIPQVDATTLQQYQMLKSGNVSDLQQNEALVGEKAPVDNQFDTVYQIGLTMRQSQGIGKAKGQNGSGSWPMISK